MAEKPQDLYGAEGSANYTLPQGGEQPSINTQANPNDFGAQIGGALEQAGGQLQKTSDQAYGLVQQATEAKVNDDYANKYAPAAADLRAKYDQLQGQDKIHGYDAYIGGLQALNKQFTAAQPSDYGQKLMSGAIDRHVESEIFGAKSELVKSTVQFNGQAAADKIRADSGYAQQNYDNPAVVGQVEKSNDATILMQHLDSGFDPSNPDHAETIHDAQNAAKGDMAVGMIQNAVSNGDVSAANNIRTQYSDAIPGYQQEAVDKTLHTENMRQAGVNGSQALIAGGPVPHTPGAQPVEVQAAVADAAQTSGIDPNHALTVARIESNMGQNLGSRGDIGQTGKGGDLQTQAANMTTALKSSAQVADNALGRQSQPWEQYLCYQQGSGGGPALLKADPNAKAVDVLSSLYDNPKDAKSAIVGNGGNATMSAGDYLNFIHNKYDANAQRSMCEFNTSDQTESNDNAQPLNPGAQILAPHQQTGQVVQPAASPRQALSNFEEKYPDMIDRANAIPNLDVRNAVFENLNRERERLKGSASAYSDQLVNKATQLAVSPTFTDMNQVPADMAAALLSEHPETMKYLASAAQSNLEKGSGAVTKDMKDYGPGMYGLMRDIDQNKVNTATDLMKHLPDANGKGGDITIAGFEKLKTLLAKDPQSSSDAAMQTQSFAYLKKQISNDGMFNKPDAVGEKNWGVAMPILFRALDDGKAKGLTMGQMTDPSNPNWIGGQVKSLIRTPTQMAIDMGAEPEDVPAGQTAPDKAPARKFSDIYQDYSTATDPDKKAALQQEATQMSPHEIAVEYRMATDPVQKEKLKKAMQDMGMIQKDGPQAPISK